MKPVLFVKWHKVKHQEQNIYVKVRYIVRKRTETKQNYWVWVYTLITKLSSLLHSRRITTNSYFLSLFLDSCRLVYIYIYICIGKKRHVEKIEQTHNYRGCSSGLISRLLKFWGCCRKPSHIQLIWYKLTQGLIKVTGVLIISI